MSQPGQRTLLRRHPATFSATATAAALAGLYLVIRPVSKDFVSGQLRTRLAEHGAWLWSFRWFGGHQLPAFGVVGPWLGARIGVHATAIVALLVAAAVFGLLVDRHIGGDRATAAAVLFAVTGAVSLWGGRLTFGPSVALGVIAVAGLVERWWWLAVPAATLCGLASPVGAALLAMCLLAVAVADPSRRRAAIGAMVATLVPIAAVAKAFPQQGWYPFTGGALALLLVSLAAVIGICRLHRAVVVAAGLYVLAGIGAFVVRTGLGGNVSRLAWLMVAPALALWHDRTRRAVTVAMCTVATVWPWVYLSMGFSSTVHVVNAAPFGPLIEFVHRAEREAGQVLRVEVLPVETYAESDLPALSILIARGWETQLDRYLNLELYRPLDATTYQRWLQRNAVSLVAVPLHDRANSAAHEAEMIDTHPAYLTEVRRTADWAIYRVAGAESLAGPGLAVEQVGIDTITLHAERAVDTVVRFRYTPYLVAGDGACVTEGPDGWIRLVTGHPGTIHLGVHFTVRAALGRASNCAAGGG